MVTGLKLTPRYPLRLTTDGKESRRKAIGSSFALPSCCKKSYSRSYLRSTSSVNASLVLELQLRHSKIKPSWPSSAASATRKQDNQLCRSSLALRHQDGDRAANLGDIRGAVWIIA